MSTQNSSLSHICNFSVSLQLVQKLVSENNSDRMNPADTEAPTGSAQEGGGVSKATHVARVSEGLSLGSALPAAQRGPRSHLTEATHTCSCLLLLFFAHDPFFLLSPSSQTPPMPPAILSKVFLLFFPKQGRIWPNSRPHWDVPLSGDCEDRGRAGTSDSRTPGAGPQSFFPPLTAHTEGTPPDQRQPRPQRTHPSLSPRAPCPDPRIHTLPTTPKS